MAKYTHITEIMKAAGDPARLRALLAVCKRELCVCDIVELLKLAPSTVSRHMSVLRRAGLVESRKDAQWVYYRANRKGVSGQFLDWLGEATGEAELTSPHPLDLPVFRPDEAGEIREIQQGKD